MDLGELKHLMTIVQDGVVSRRQILRLGGTDHDIRRMVRRRELVALHKGVYVDHTGDPSRAQWEWAAVLFLWPAALSHESALGVPAPDRRIHLAVPASRTLRPPSGLKVHRMENYEKRVDPMTSPPCIRRAEAVIDAAGLRTPEAAFTLLADVLHDRRVTIPQIRAALQSARMRDSVRDLHTLVDRAEETVRITFHQVYVDPCETAALLGSLLQRRGWPGRLRRCPKCR